jgi:hypothetical protein
MSKEAKKKAVHTRQINLEGKEVTEEANGCYFCGKTVDTYYASITKAGFGHIVCASCTAKIVRIISCAGTRFVA